MTAGDICNRNVVVAPKTETVVDAAKRMRMAHVGDIVVVVEGRQGQHVPVGIVTDRDIVVSLVAGDADHLGFLSLHDMMTADARLKSGVASLLTRRIREKLHEALEQLGLVVHPVPRQRDGP